MLNEVCENIFVILTQFSLQTKKKIFVFLCKHLFNNMKNFRIFQISWFLMKNGYKRNRWVRIIAWTHWQFQFLSLLHYNLYTKMTWTLFFILWSWLVFCCMLRTGKTSGRRTQPIILFYASCLLCHSRRFLKKSNIGIHSIASNMLEIISVLFLFIIY